MRGAGPAEAASVWRCDSDDEEEEEAADAAEEEDWPTAAAASAAVISTSAEFLAEAPETEALEEPPMAPTVVA